MTRKISLWLARLAAAIILGQSLYFKLISHSETIYIFQHLEMEPWGRIGTGALEFIAALLILLPRTSRIGAWICVFLMAGVLYFHLTDLGIVVQNDGGKLFTLAIIVLIAALVVLGLTKRTRSKIVKSIDHQEYNI